jgi:hypothetical protein
LGVGHESAKSALLMGVTIRKRKSMEATENKDIYGKAFLRFSI